MRKKTLLKKHVTKFVAIVLFSCMTLIGFSSTSVSASPAKSISSFNIYAYGYDANGEGIGWHGNTTANISRSNLYDLWCITQQVGYGSIDYVKIDGTNVKYTDDKSAWLKSGREVTGWQDVIKITDNSFVSNLSNGRHTITIQCSTRNTFPYRSLTATAHFNIVD